MGRQKEEPLFNRIEQARVARGLSRQQLADAVGVHYQTIGYLERGQPQPEPGARAAAGRGTGPERAGAVLGAPFRSGALT